jgi:hypothetical protein
VAPAGSRIAYDAVSGRTARVRSGRIGWRFEPYGAALLRIGRPPEGEVPPERHQAQSQSAVASNAPFVWERAAEGTRFEVAGLEGMLIVDKLTVRSVRRGDGGVRITATAGAPGEGELSLQVLGVDRWLVDTVTGVYEDRLMRRHFPWPEGLYHWEPSYVWGYEPHNLYSHVLPAGRQWQSAVAPVCEGGQIAFAGPGGKGIAIRDIVTNAMNVVLTDRSEQPDPEPYGLRLRFVSRDKALSARWVPEHRRTGWVEMPTAPFSRLDKSLHVAFTVAPLRDFERAVGRAQPLAAPAGARQSIGPGERVSHHNRLWLVEPNTVRWTGLPLGHEGDYTLWLQLRHSERGPDQTELTEHYHVTLDGRAIPLEWSRLDVWRTGNGYFGWAKGPAGRLGPGRHSLAIRTSHRWCALLPRSYISRDASFRP